MRVFLVTYNLSTVFMKYKYTYCIQGPSLLIFVQKTDELTAGSINVQRTLHLTTK